MPAKAALPKILIVDDAAAVRGMLRVLLTHENYDVVADLASGSSALAAIERFQPDIVCLDYNLPDTDGLDLLRQIHEAHPAIAVIMITGSQDARLESEAAKAGAAGYIRKPFTPGAVLAELRQVIYTRRTLNTAQQPAAETTGSERVTAAAPRATAVIADDNAIMRQLLRTILERNGIAVVGEACDGQQAVDLVERHTPEIVCLDIEMPVMNGLDALQQIHAKHPAAKTVMITGNTKRDAIMQAGKAGAHGYVIKPFEPERVIEVIGKLLA